MAEFIDCKYDENLVNRLTQISDEFFTTTDTDNSEEENAILNYNTRILNREVNSFRKLRNSLAKSNKITPLTKRKFGERFIPKPLYQEYQRTNIPTVQNLIDFLQVNSQFFRNPFTEDRILSVVSELDPLSFRTFENEFPSTDARLRSGPISSAEVNSLIRDNGLDSRFFAAQVESNRNGILKLLERFLSALGIGVGIMGSFCALVDNVFALSKGQKDLTGNSTQFLENFTNVLGLVNPQAGQTLSQVQELIALAQEAQQNSTDIATNLQNAFGILASAFGIIMNFIPAGSETPTSNGSIELDWNFEAIRDAIAAQDPLFLVTVDKTGKPLGDIDQNNIVDGSDVSALQTYIDGSASETVAEYVDNVLINFLNENASTYSEYSDFPSADSPDSNLSNVINDFSSVASKFGSLGGSGDFGLGQITQIISIAGGIISSIQGLISGSRPVNIKGLLQQLDQIVELGSSSIQSLFAGFDELSADYKKTTEDALKEAENNSVDNPEKTAEINTKNQESLKDNFSKALETVGNATKNLGKRLIQVANQIRNSISSLAAVGVLENLEQQLSSVIDQSANQLKSKIGFFNPTSLDNGYHFNMGSSYGKMAGLIAAAKNAVSNDTTESMKNSVKGMIAQSAEKYRQKNKEEVEFVALRFCKLAGEIERIYDQITSPLENMINEYKSTDRLLLAVGNENTLRAVEAGAIRYDTQTRLQAMQQAGNVEATITAPYINGVGQRSTIPGQNTQVKIFPPVPSDYDFPTFEQALQGYKGVRYASLTRGSARAETGPPGFLVKPYGGVNEDAMVKLFILAREWGREIQINSAYRSPIANANVGGAKNSHHLRGNAFDCSTSGLSFSERVEFCNFAIRAGFTGIITYDGFIHIAINSTEKGGIFNYFNLPGPNGYKTTE